MKWTCSVCGYTHEGDTPPEKCPQCGKMLFIKKTKKQLYCRDRNCGYFRDMSDTEQDEENK